MTADEVTRALAAWKVPGASVELPIRELSIDAWDTLQEAVTEHRMWGLLAAAVAEGDLPADAEQSERAQARHRQAMNSVLELEAMAVRAVKALTDRGIGTRLLKGLATAHIDEVDPSLRCFNDVDLLVPAGELPVAIDVLGELGYERDLPDRGHGFDLRFAKEATMRCGNGREIDLHRMLALGAFGLSVDPDDLWAEAATIVLAGVPHEVLDADRRLLHACYAAVLGDPIPRLVQLRDIGLLLTGGRVDTEEVRRIARRWRGEAVLAEGITIAAHTLSARDWPLLDWACGHRPSSWERRVLRAYRAHGGTNTRVLLSGVLAPLGSRARLSYLRGLLLPARAYAVARRAAGRPPELRTGLHELVRRRRDRPRS